MCFILRNTSKEMGSNTSKPAADAAKNKARPTMEVLENPPKPDTVNECSVSEEDFGNAIFNQFKNNSNEQEFSYLAKTITTLVFKKSILSQPNARLDTKRHLSWLDKAKIRHGVAMYGLVRESVEEAFPRPS
ncbi:hypothetical protein J8273_5884 [Carpediemonas membranifera]|uniref:Uncharacterized protein n=1 Tax=Carpediemonas membranifera TaxID=201153 RepID=A0A8J6AVP1_9EUKA|nr:hypothetical protein J8273_5884 [Carpediemonas membranifera]|eukprot:KAG9392745.1 hypothetical protein J8273_5884 [Carpediemonas membranifera]